MFHNSLLGEKALSKNADLSLPSSLDIMKAGSPTFVKRFRRYSSEGAGFNAKAAKVCAEETQRTELNGRLSVDWRPALQSLRPHSWFDIWAGDGIVGAFTGKALGQAGRSSGFSAFAWLADGLSVLGRAEARTICSALPGK